jgi:hypothetical protein
MRAFSLGLMALLFISAAEPVTEPAAKPAPVLIAKPALWKVSDADTTIYLFGTIHLLKPGTQWFEGKIKTAFDASDELVLEMVQPSEADAQKIVISRAIDPDGPPLSQKLTPKDAAKYRAALKTLDIDPQGLEPFEPWFASTLVAMAPMQKLGYDPEAGAEKVLTAEAEAASKKIGALESMEEQIGFFDTLPEDQQIKFLNFAVAEIPKAKKVVSVMVGSWAKGNPDTLAAVMNDGMNTMPAIKKVLLTDRNQRWADWIAKRMEQPGTVFVAVGAGHLAGKESVQAMLKANHLEAVRIN